MIKTDEIQTRENVYAPGAITLADSRVPGPDLPAG